MLELAAEGFTNQEIGTRLFISESTVRFHVQKLKAKFAARTKTELIAKAIRTGLHRPGRRGRRHAGGLTLPTAEGTRRQTEHGLSPLADAARRVLGADAVVVSIAERGEAAAVSTAAGLSPLELEHAEAGLWAHGPVYFDRAYEGVLHGAIDLGGESLGTIHALQRAEAALRASRADPHLRVPVRVVDRAGSPRRRSPTTGWRPGASSTAWSCPCTTRPS